MEEEDRSAGASQDYVEFWPAGVSVKGEFHCSECGYGVTIHRALPICPMCGGQSWEQTAWHPFSRSEWLRAKADAFARDPGSPLRG